MKQQKRYEYWGTENGKPIKKFIPWFDFDGPQEPWQLKPKLKNEYRIIENENND